MMKRLGTAILIIALFLTGCASMPARQQDYVVQRGDTLYSIAWRYGVDFRTLARANDIPAPYLILPGQRLRLPAAGNGAEGQSAGGAATPPGGKPVALTSRTEYAVPRPLAPYPVSPPRAIGKPFRHGDKSSEPVGEYVSVVTRPEQETTVQTAPVAAEPAPEPVRTQPSPVQPPSRPAASSEPASQPAPASVRRVAAIAWRWPSSGKVVQTFAQGKDGRRGLNISGKQGQPILAAADGTVVYSGDGLRGYGNLVIVKHDNDYLTAYGYNAELLVGEGDAVRAGQRIATMGLGPTRAPVLHFEIRRKGAAVDPAKYLPPR